MTTTTLKRKLIALVEKERDMEKLRRVFALFEDGSNMASEPAAEYVRSPAGRGKGARTSASARQPGRRAGALQRSVARSESEFIAGKGISLTEFEREMDRMVDELFPATKAERPTDRRTAPTVRKRMRK